MKYIATVLLIVVLSTPLFAAGGAEATETGDGQAQLQVFHRWPEEAGTHGVAQAHMFELFAEEHPDIDLSVDSVPASVYEVQLSVRLASATPPDVFALWPGGRVEALVRDDQLMDITDLYEQQGWFDEFNEGDIEGARHFDGNFYIMPFNKMYNTFWYNKTLFDEYGWEEPQTWDELLTLAEDIKAYGIYPFALGAQPTRWAAAFWFDYLLLGVAGSEFRERLMWGEESWESPEVRRTFEIWKEVVDNEYFTPDFGSVDWRESLNHLIQGNAAMILMGDWTIPTLMSDDVGWVPEEDFDFFAFPNVDPSTPYASEGAAEGWVINANAQNPEEARTLLAWYGTKESLTEYAQIQTVLTPRADVSIEVYPEESQSILSSVAERLAPYRMHQNYELSTLPDMQDVGMDAFVEFLTQPERLGQILSRVESTARDTFDN